MFAHEIQKPEAPDDVRRVACKQLQSQAYYVSNELARRWCQRFGDARLYSTSSVRELSRTDLFRMSKWFASHAGVARDQVRELFIAGKPPELVTLLKLAHALGHCIRLDLWPFAGTTGISKYEVRISDAAQIPVKIGALLRHMESKSTLHDLHRRAGIAKSTLHAAEQGTRYCKFNTLFHTATAYGYQLNIRFE